MHGDLDNVYSTLLYLEKVENTKIDLLICCGDFQVRSYDAITYFVGDSRVAKYFIVLLFIKYWLSGATFEVYKAVRNEKDLESLNVPRKYRSMNSFWKYYSGQEVAPFPTIFIGGNHEASNYLWEL